MNKVSTILDLIDSHEYALPEFQRGYVWTREQVKSLFYSLYRKHPVGGLLVWVTDAATTKTRGPSARGGTLRLILDGQQRITSIYGVARNRPPPFFEGNAASFTGLHFNIEKEIFEFKNVRMEGDPHWIEVHALLNNPTKVFGTLKQPEHMMRAMQLKTHVLDREVHEDLITGNERTVDEVVDIFNRVNSGGTKLTAGDLTLATLCASAPNTRKTMNEMLTRWRRAGFEFDLDWLLRCMSGLHGRKADLTILRGISQGELSTMLTRSERAINYSLNLIGSRLGLDHDRVLPAAYPLAIMARYLDERNCKIDGKSQSKLLYWYVQASMWGRYSGSTETVVTEDLQALDGNDQDIDKLVAKLERWRGTLEARPSDFDAATLGARFYPILYMLARVNKTLDLCTGMEIRAGMLGAGAKLQVHHIIPKKRLRDAGRKPREINSLANLGFLMADSNLHIGAKKPEQYLAEVHEKFPKALVSQWIPTDPRLWKVAKYDDFLEHRREALADALNRFLSKLVAAKDKETDVGTELLGTAEGTSADAELDGLDTWLNERGLALPRRAYVVRDAKGTSSATVDAAWPDGVPIGSGSRIALLRPDAEEPDAASEARTLLRRAGFEVFETVDEVQAALHARVEGAAAE